MKVKVKAPSFGVLGTQDLDEIEDSVAKRPKKEASRVCSFYRKGPASLILPHFVTIRSLSREL